MLGAIFGMFTGFVTSVEGSLGVGGPLCKHVGTMMRKMFRKDTYRAGKVTVCLTDLETGLRAVAKADTEWEAEREAFEKMKRLLKL